MPSQPGRQGPRRRRRAPAGRRGGAVGRPRACGRCCVVEDEHLEVVDARSGAQVGQQQTDPGLLVARRHQDAHPLADRRRVRRRAAEQREVDRGVRRHQGRGHRPGAHEGLADPTAAVTGRPRRGPPHRPQQRRRDHRRHRDQPPRGRARRGRARPRARAPNRARSSRAGARDRGRAGWPRWRGTTRSSTAATTRPPSSQPARLVSGMPSIPGRCGSGKVQAQWPASTICGSR